MKNICKIIILVVAVMAIAYCGIILFTHSADTKVFLAQSVLDNAVFCVMFLFVAWITGINC